MKQHIITRREKRTYKRSRLDSGESWSGSQVYRPGWLPWRDEDTRRLLAEIERLRAVDRSRRNRGHVRWGAGPSW